MTVITSIGYDSSAETLEIEFKDGGVYQYYNVPDIIHEQFMESESKGKFLHANILDEFPNSRV